MQMWNRRVKNNFKARFISPEAVRMVRNKRLESRAT